MFDLWAQRWRRQKASGDVVIIRYADDTIVGFQHEHEAKAFLQDLHERLREFELALHPDKTADPLWPQCGRRAQKARGSGPGRGHDSPCI